MNALSQSLRSRMHCALSITALHIHCALVYTALSPSMRSHIHHIHWALGYTACSRSLRSRIHCAHNHCEAPGNEREGLIKRLVFHLDRWFGAARGYSQVLDGSASVWMTLLTCRDNLSGPRLTVKCKSLQLELAHRGTGRNRFQLGVGRTWSPNK